MFRQLRWLFLPVMILAVGCSTSPEPLSHRVQPAPEPAATAIPQPEHVPRTVALAEVTGGLTEPTGVVGHPDDPDVLYVTERRGLVVVIEHGQVRPRLFLNISSRVSALWMEQGLLGLAFHPDYPDVPSVFVNYTNRDGDTVVERYTVDPHSATADPDSAETVLQVEQPTYLHNGGHIEFGPDGYLYIGMGDGGSHGDPYENAQNPNTLLGALLRIDVDNGSPYTIPHDNPFVEVEGVRDEIWAIGLRNPWRFSFDRQTGDLYIADVGEMRVEEVNYQPSTSSGGENYGWPIMEGTDCFEAVECDASGFTLPVREYLRDEGCAVTGGAVYRGPDMPDLDGAYIHSDFCTGIIWALSHDGGEWQTETLSMTGRAISAVTSASDGAIYLADYTAGSILRLTPAGE